MNSSLYVLLVKLFASMAVAGTIVGIGLYAWDLREERTWDETDVRWRRQLARERRELRRLEREDGG